MGPIHTITFLLAITTPAIWSRGIKEEFTWTRISYIEGAAQGRSVRATTEPKNANVSTRHGDITFPGSTNEEESGSQGDSSTPTSTSNYIYENNIPMGANIWKNKLFITVPRRRLGVPATLNYVRLDHNERHNVPLIPYPNLAANTLIPENNGDNLVSVYRVAIDKCDQLWFVDTGLIELPGNATRIREATLVVMNLNTDHVIRRHTFDTSLIRPATGLASVTLDTLGSRCQNSFAYIPDLGGYGLIVYSFSEDRSWRVTHNYFYLEPMAGEFFVAGHRFQWNDGIFSIALTELRQDKTRTGYFHSMAGTHLYKVNTRVLRNESLATRSYHEEDFKIVGDRGDQAQTSASDLHKSTGILFLGLVNQNALGCWNTRSRIQDTAVIQKDDQKMIYPSDVKISGDKVILLTNTMPGFLYGNLDYNIVNFRVWIGNVQKVVEGTKCATGGGHGNYRN